MPSFTTDWFAEQARLGKLYTACNQTGSAVTLINTSTATGFILSNPYGSGKKLILKEARFAYTTVPAATAVIFLAMSSAISTTAHASTTALTVYGADGSGPATSNAGRAYSASTTPNLPVYSRVIGYAPTTPATTGGLTFVENINGSMVLVPGSYVQISYITTAPTGIASMTWGEVDEV